MANSNTVKLETLEKFQPKLGKHISKLELKLEKWKKLELPMHSNLKFGRSMKLKFDKK